MKNNTLSYTIEGEFITQLARDKCYSDGDINSAIKLLHSCMKGTDLKQYELHQLIFSILNGEASLKGTYPNEDYGFQYLDKPDDAYNLASYITNLNLKLKESQKKIEELEDLYLIAKEYIPSYNMKDFLINTGQAEPSQSPTYSSLLSSFMKRAKDNIEHSTGDYGWLHPDGTFYEVEWGFHQTWAQEYVLNHMTEEQKHDAKSQKTSYLRGITASYGDYLVEHGWVLLHNPSQGIAIPTRNPLKRYTKAQADFLYTYYKERNCTKEANDILNDI